MRLILSKKSIALMSVIITSFILSSLYTNFSYIEEDDLYVRGRLLLQPKPGVSEDQVQKLVRSHGGKQISKIEQINLHVIELPPQASEKAVEALLKHHPLLNFAERDRYIEPSLIANDPYFGNAWHLPQINAPMAWDSTKGDGVIIAILDSGVDPAHPDLASKLVPGYNFYDNNTNTADVYGHGTKCAGAAAAIGNNSLGVTGVSWNSKIMPIRVTGTNGYATWSGLANGLIYAADHGARVASMSFLNPSTSSSVVSAASYLKSKGGLAVGAIGNTGALDSTANSSEIIIVSATGSSDSRPSWSAYGPSVDIAAPGVSIYTTTNGGGYGAVSGTSAATPVAAATIALIMSANPNLKPTQIENILFSTAKDLGDTGWDQYYGHGRVDAGSSVQLALNTVASDATNPTVSFLNPTNGSKISGIVPISVNASDNIALNRVELYIGSSLLASDNLAPYEFSFDSTSKSDGNYTLTAKAIDSSGNASSTSITLAIDNYVDTVAPTITISNPANGSVVKGNIAISASASDNEGVSSMSLYIDGALRASSSSGSISYSWNTRKVSSGVHSIKVEAKDLSGNVASSTIQVTK